MFQFHPAGGFSDALRFVRVGRQRFAGLDSAEGAIAGAGVPQDKEGGGAAGKTFSDVRAMRFPADGMQVLLGQEAVDFQRFRIGQGNFEPGRFFLAKKHFFQNEKR